jgi:hypothetical protein
MAARFLLLVEAQSQWWKRPSITDWIMAALTLAYVCVNFFVLSAIKKQSKIANKAARAAKVSADAIMNIERPWHLVVDIQTDSLPHPTDSTKRLLAGYFLVKNFGKSPGWIVDMGGSFDTLSKIDDLPSEPTYRHSVTEKDRGIVLVPQTVDDEESKLSRQPYRFAHTNMLEEQNEEFQRATRHEIVWCIYGFVVYRDSFGRMHETRFCHVLDDWPRFRAVDAGPNYNRHT